jgi:hypothetical protein
MNPKIKRALKDPYYACELVLNQLAMYISDQKFVKWKYYLNFHKELNMDNPQTFNEKLQWLKLNDQHEEYTQMVDKCEAKKYIASILGDDYVIPTLGVYDSFDDIDFEVLPQQFVLKCTHNSGGVVICRDKEKLDIKKAKLKFEKWLGVNPFWKNREYPYKNIKPRIIAEQYMTNDDSSLELTDYKFFCFDGYVDCVMVCLDRHLNDTKFYFFNKDWELLRLNIRGKNAPEGFTIPKPKTMDEMFEIAGKLSKGMKFVRIDLYEIRGHVYFGEYTFFPDSGLDPNLLPETDQFFGDLIKL